MNSDKLYASLTANTAILAKLTNQFKRIRLKSLITPPTDKHYSLDCEDEFRSNVSHQQQFFSELPSPGQSHYTKSNY